ncbi:Acetyltransferase (GNAT) family protein [compost metagenome]
MFRMNLTADEVIGYCGFMNTHPPSRDLDIVYAFPTKYTGKGYATEVCKALVELAKASKFDGGISAVVNPENKASIKVLEKCGFVSEGFCIGDLNHLLKYRYR